MRGYSLFLSLFVLGLVGAFGLANPRAQETEVKRVVVMDLVDRNSDFNDEEKLILMGYIGDAVSRLPGYGAGWINCKEWENCPCDWYDIERPSEARMRCRIEWLRKMHRCDLILSSEIVKLDAVNFVMASKLISADEGEIKGSAVVSGRNDSTAYVEICRRLVSKLFNM